MQYYSASKIFNGREWLDNKLVAVDGGKVIAVLDKEEREAAGVEYLDGYLVPSLIDIQVYGAAGKLLAVHPTKDTLQLMYESFKKEGTVLFLPTLATNTIEVFKQGIDAIRTYWDAGGQGVYGLHLEGPWIHVEKRGAHVKELIHSPTIEEATELLDYGKGIIKMITLAPETCSGEVIDLVRSHGIIISAGHSNASFTQAIQSFENGIASVTHLFNAMTGLHHREPGLVGACFQHQNIMASIIPDGYHVDFEAIAIAKKMMGDRLFAITDAVTETSTGPYRHQLSGDKYECNGVLSGSALSMYKGFLNLVQKVKLDAAEAHRMCSLYPARLLKCDDKYGQIKAGQIASFLLLDKAFNLKRLI